MMVITWTNKGKKQPLDAADNLDWLEPYKGNTRDELALRRELR
jgi:hypothetical protein